MLHFVRTIALAALVILAAGAGAARADVASMIPGLPLTGRVVGPDGSPLSHVPVYVLTKSPTTVADTLNHVAGSTIRENGQTVQTDDQGLYTAQGIQPGDTVSIFVSKAGYRYISGGDISSGFDGYHASDLVEEPPAAILAGKVLTPAGDPALDAVIIAPASNIDLTGKTDPTGEFVLEGLPSGETDVFAVSPAGYGRVKAQTGQSNLVIKLAPVTLPGPADLSRGANILTDLFRRTAGTAYAGHDSIPFELAPYDLSAALSLATKNGPPSDAVLLGLVTASTLGDVAASAPTANTIFDAIADPGEKALAAAAYGIALTPAHPELAATLLEKAKGWARQSPIEHLGGGERIAVAALAARLKDRDANKLIDDTISDMVDGARKANRGNPQSADDVVEQFLGDYAVVAAPAGSAAIERVMSRLPASDPKEPKRLPRLLPTLRACGVLARYDVQDAYSLMRRTLTSGATTGMPIYGQAACEIVRQLSATDPQAALTLARTVIDQEHKPVALAYAAAGLSADQAGPVWRDALSAALASRNRTALSGWVAALAAQRDKPLGGLLFVSALKALNGQAGLPGGMSSFMFYYAQVDPAKARIVIEQEYAAGQLAMRGSDDDSLLMPPTLAMSAVDLDRALEMASSIHGPTGAPATRKIAQYIMLSPEAKHELRFDRWSQPDAWLPGSPVE